MKTTRLLLAFAAALSLGLAVFAGVRTNNSTSFSTHSTFKVGDNDVPNAPGDDSPPGDDDDSGSGGGGNSGH